MISRKTLLNRTHVFSPAHPLSIYRNAPWDKSGKILYYGWLSDGNFGDDILAEIAKREFSKYLLHSAYPEIAYEDRLAAEIFGYSWETARMLGGGTLIGRGFEKFINLNLPRNMPTFTFASGALPLEHWRQENVEGWEKFLKNATAISVRGFRSASRVEEITGRSDVRVIGDFALAASDYMQKRIPVAAQRTRAKLGVNFGSHLFQHDQQHISKIRELLLYLILTLSADVDFVGVYLHEIDERLAKDTFSAAGVELKHEIALHKYPAKLPELAELDAVISERLHGSILSHSYDTPCLGLGYHDKVLDHFETMDQQHNYVFLEGLEKEDVVRRVEKVLEDRTEISRQISTVRLRWRTEQKKFVEDMILELSSSGRPRPK